MKTNIITLFLLFISVSLFPQVMEFDCHSDNNGSAQLQSANANTLFKSSNGNHFPTQGTFRSLTLFVNIIYDVYPSQDPYPVSSSQAWKPDVNSSINSPNYRPSYLLDLFDTAIQSSGNYHGVVTRLYAESSFNQLILLSDFVVVNIKQSQIKSSSTCIEDTLKNRVIAFINANGGLNTCYGNNTIAEYDKFTSNSIGIEKSMLPDGQIDLVNFLYRNTTIQYGHNDGGGLTTLGTDITNIKVGNQSYGFNYATSQRVGTGSIAANIKNVLTHEYAHLFLGDNSFHTSGGVTNNVSSYNTFIGRQWGYGLFGSYNGLTSCNGYERWRLGWRGTSNNAYPIASSNINSDIAKFTGEKTFVLRDFVTYGDAIRIKLPYKDIEQASNQYIWLENHQSGKNNKQDTYMFSFPGSCRDIDGRGIHAYYQVGKDILEGSYNDVFPSNEMDNLRMISAEGNYNVLFTGDSINDCLEWGLRSKFQYLTPNPLQGINDENEVFNYNSSTTTFTSANILKYLGAKYKNGIWQNNQPWEGDQYDTFVPNPEVKMDISTNPTAVNTTTYYSVRNSNTYEAKTTKPNTRKIYLTGLSIKMTDPQPSNTGMKAYTVKIRWDDYDVKQNVNWTGDIVLKEQLNLLPNKTIVLEQNLTPYQFNRNSVSGVFAPPTKFTCENNSVINLAQDSKINIKDKSSFILENGSTMNIQDGAEIIVEAGSTFIVKAGANLNIQGKGKITIMQGGYVCVQSGSNINLQDYSSVIFLRGGALYGANPLLFTNTSCLSVISFTGNGSVIDGSVDVYIQNESITNNRYIGGQNIYVGNNVTSSKPQGNVIITNNANVIFDAGENVYFEPGFECTLGASYEVRQ